ncbi:MAG: hypothetical protein K2N10_01915, partial [Muribaculaceae bacterium]|nr:hypothetical protein [Muribaculaceae bacterium]
YYTLDATANSEFCGNWIPNDAGTNWTAYQLDMTNGTEAALAAVKAALVKEAADAMIQEYVGYFNAYIENVPWVAEELQAGIAALNALQPTEAYSDEIVAIWNTACDNANATLKTIFNGKIVALKSPRRVALGNAPYVGTNVEADKYAEVATFANATADFTMTTSGEEGGYVFYNEATQTYIGTGCTPVAEESAAQVLYPYLRAQGAYAGLALATEANGTNGLNFQSWANGSVSFYLVADEGSIWSLVEADDAAKSKDVIDANVAKLAPYIDYLPEMVANILTDAIDDIKALTYSETIADEAAEIAETALASANELLATGMNGIKLTLLNLRQNKFMSIANDVWVYSEYNDVAETEFTFKAQADGGYILYNEAANIYIGAAVTDAGGSQTDVQVATEEADAQVLYPFIHHNGNFYGVALALEANPTGATTSLNTNNNASIFHTYRADDGGSIFGLLPFGKRSGIDAVAAPAKAQLQGIYDLQGRKLAAPVKGINIINGVKVLVK